jgi:hypothetical protein
MAEGIAQPRNPDALRPQEQDPKMTSPHSAEVLGDESLRVTVARMMANHEDFDNRIRQTAALAFDNAVSNSQSANNQRASQDGRVFGNLHTSDDLLESLANLAGARNFGTGGVAHGAMDLGAAKGSNVSQAAQGGIEATVVTTLGAILQSLAGLTQAIDALKIEIVGDATGDE